MQVMQPQEPPKMLEMPSEIFLEIIDSVTQSSMLVQ
jgi:hypothetical protein